MDYKITPKFTAPTTSGYTVTASSAFSANFAGWKAFDEILNDDYQAWVTPYKNTSEWLSVKCPNDYNLTSYKITSREFSVGESPKSWNVYGVKDGQEYLISTVSNQINWSRFETREFLIPKENKFDEFKFTFLNNNGSTSYIAVQELSLFGNTNFYYHKLLLKSNNDCYYYSAGTWNRLDYLTLTSNDFITYGMDGIGSEINDFSNTISKSFEVLYLTDSPNIKELELNGYSSPQIVKASGDISLLGIESIDYLNLIAIGDTKIALSVDGGLTYNAYRNSAWVVVSDASEGMTSTEFNLLDNLKLKALLGNSKTLRFSYFLNTDSEVDKIEMRVTMQGTEQIAKSSDYSLSYYQSQRKLVYTISKSGTYSVNYVDGSA